MRQSENIDQLAKALAAAQATMPHAIFNKMNPHFKSRYADMSSVHEATVPHLSANGLSISQTTDFENGRYVLFTCLLHQSGQWKAGVIPLLDDPTKPQAMQSSLTYASRGGWSKICGVAVAGEDDDGNAAEHEAGKMVTNSELQELMKIAEDRQFNMPELLLRLSARLGYPMESLSMLRRDDMLKVRGWMEAKKKKDTADAE